MDNSRNKIKVVNQCRLWALRNPGGDIIFHIAETMQPTLFTRRMHADAFVKKAKANDMNIEAVEIQIILKEPEKKT